MFSNQPHMASISLSPLSLTFPSVYEEEPNPHYENGSSWTNVIDFEEVNPTENPDFTAEQMMDDLNEAKIHEWSGESGDDDSGYQSSK
jgi:hypothetical protein